MPDKHDFMGANVHQWRPRGVAGWGWQPVSTVDCTVLMDFMDCATRIRVADWLKLTPWAPCGKTTLSVNFGDL